MGGRDRLHTLERFQATLRLARLARLVAEALDEGLHVRHFALLTFEGRLLAGQLGRARHFEGTIVPRVELEAPVLQLRDHIDHTIEKVPIMRNE